MVIRSVLRLARPSTSSFERLKQSEIMVAEGGRGAGYFYYLLLENLEKKNVTHLPVTLFRLFLYNSI